jgi:hypothetical protein
MRIAYRRSRIAQTPCRSSAPHSETNRLPCRHNFIS